MLAAELLLLALLFFGAVGIECVSPRHNPALLELAFWGCVSSLYATMGVAVAGWM